MSRDAVLSQLAAAYESLAERGQLLVGQGRYDEAHEMHELARLVLRAYAAEEGNPVPRATCACVQCGLYRVGVRRI